MIVKLEPNVANQIAAGEVIERPSSVVKELIENSIDAGAKSIDVEILGAGRELIRVRDDGEGIEEADFPLVFQRSATSKIKKIEDVYSLMSLGFRGEALASIASVAKCDLSSAREGAPLGKKLSVAGGEVSGIEEINFKQGTEIRVRDLFYNTPVRYKFLKSDAVEKSRVIKIVSMLALSHPNLAFHLTVDGSEVLALKAGSNLRERLQAIYGRDFARALIPMSASANDIYLAGYLAGPEYSLGNRSRQFFIINGRVAEAEILKRALNEAYDGLLMKHRYQAYALTLDIPPHLVDVNCHPQKLEVKFQMEDIIYSLVYNACRNALIADRTEARAAMQPSGSERPKPQEPEPQEHEPQELKPIKVPGPTEESYEKRYLKQLLERVQAKKDEEVSPVKDESYLSYEKEMDPGLGEALAYENEEVLPYLAGAVDLKPTRDEAKPYLSMDFSCMRIVGQALKTFIVLEKGDALYFVDQHAAHERVLFERFYKEFKEGRVVSQMLLQPFEMRVPLGEEGSYAEALDFFLSMGIEAEMKDGAILVKALPVFGSIIGIEEMKHLIESYLEHGKGAYSKNFVDAIIMRSCKAAIKSGDELNEFQMRDLLSMLSSCENPKTCPHGRPVVIELDRRFFDKLFKRIV